MKKFLVVILASFALVGVGISHSDATTTSTAFVCGVGNEALSLSCGGTVTVDDVADTVTLTFTTFSAPGTQIDTLGIQLPGSAAFNSATTAGLNTGYASGAGNLAFEAEIGCSTSCPSSLANGFGDTPFSLKFAYTGTDFTAADVVDVPNRTGSCSAFHDDLWGCMHVFRFDSTPSSEFVPLMASVPEPGTLLLVCSGLLGLGVIARRKR